MVAVRPFPAVARGGGVNPPWVRRAKSAAPAAPGAQHCRRGSGVRSSAPLPRERRGSAPGVRGGRPQADGDLHRGPADGPDRLSRYVARYVAREPADRAGAERSFDDLRIRARPRPPCHSLELWPVSYANVTDHLAWPWQNRTAGGDTGQNGKESTMSASRSRLNDALLATADIRVLLSCPSCGSAHVAQVLGDNGGVSYVCTSCGHSWN